jgi:hypothetical protein
MNHQTKKETKEQFSNGHEKYTRQQICCIFSLVAKKRFTEDFMPQKAMFNKNILHN